MNETNFSTATNSGSLDDVIGVGSTAERAINVQVTNNMGNRTFLMHMPMKEFFSQSLVANEGHDGEAITQRKLDKKHAMELAKYLFKGLIGAAINSRTAKGQEPLAYLTKLLDLLGKQPYVSIQPIVCNLRDVGKGGSKLRAERLIDHQSGTTIGFKVFLPQEAVFHVVDGQHRRYAMELLLEFLKQAIQTRKLTKKSDNLILPLHGEVDIDLLNALNEVLLVASTISTVQIESHLGLDIEEERQLFHDLNNLGKKVDASLVLQFDSANPVNAYIKEALIDDDSLLSWEVVERDSTEWNDDSGAISRKELTSINARLFLNATNINNASMNKVNDMKPTANRFWSAINDLEYLGEFGAKAKTVAAQPVFLKALAKLAYDFSNGKFKDTNTLDIFFDELNKLNLSHNNPVWRYFNLTDEQRAQFELSSLADYFPDDIETKSKVRTFCVYEESNNLLKFGSRHNDVYPIITEMIRFMMGLAPKKKRAVRKTNATPDLFISSN
ncbi:hypothetical protein P0E20_005398 [Vibrio harveyi]|nr:hypothetical protein [Vibrio harveyi]